MKLFLHISFLLLTLNLWSQPTGNEELVLDIYDIVDSDTLFISKKVPFIPMHKEKMKVDFEGKKLKMLKTSFIQKEVVFKNYRLIDKSSTFNPGFQKMSYDSLLSVKIIDGNKLLQIIRNKKDTMNLEFVGISGRQYVKVPFLIGNFKIVVNEKAVNKKCYELLPIVSVNNSSYQNISPYYLEMHRVKKETPEHNYNVLWQYTSQNTDNSNKSILGTKHLNIGSFVIECKLTDNTLQYERYPDMGQFELATFKFNGIDILVKDSVRNKTLYDTAILIQNLSNFDFENCISYAYTRESGFNRFNLVLTTSFNEPKKYFTYLLEKDKFVYNLNINAQMNKGRVVDGNFIFEVIRKTVPIDNGLYVPRMEEYWNYKVTNILSNKIVMDLDVPFHSNQIKGEDSIQQIDVNFDNFPDLHISSQIPQWNCYFVYNLERDTFVYEPYINSLENLKIDFHDEVVTGEYTTAIQNLDKQGVKRPPVEFIKEEYCFEGLGLRNVTKISTRIYSKDNQLKKEFIKKENLLYENQRLIPTNK